MSNAILSPTITYLLIYRYGRRSWYIDILTFLNWILASVVVWGLQNYIRFFGPTAPNLAFENNLPQAVRHLGSLDSCGGSSALNLCVWATGISPIRNFYEWSYQSAQTVPNTIAAIWTVCSVVHLVIFYISISNFIRKYRGVPMHSSSAPTNTTSTTPTPRTPASQIAKYQPVRFYRIKSSQLWDLTHDYGSGAVVFSITSVAIFVCAGFQADLFAKLLNSGYIDFSEW